MIFAVNFTFKLNLSSTFSIFIIVVDFNVMWFLFWRLLQFFAVSQIRSRCGKIVLGLEHTFLCIAINRDHPNFQVPLSCSKLVKTSLMVWSKWKGVKNWLGSVILSDILKAIDSICSVEDPCLKIELKIEIPLSQRTLWTVAVKITLAFQIVSLYLQFLSTSFHFTHTHHCG